jgi:hypothetical protein
MVMNEVAIARRYVAKESLKTEIFRARRTIFLNSLHKIT